MAKIDNTKNQILGLWAYCGKQKSSSIIAIKNVVFSLDKNSKYAEYKCSCGETHKILL